MREWTMTYLRRIFFSLLMTSAVSAGQTLFTSGPQAFAGQKYYWLAEWKLEVTLPRKMAEEDQFEVLFGTNYAR